MSVRSLLNNFKLYFLSRLSKGKTLNKKSKKLSAFEIKIIELICKEYSNQKIATNLSINLKSLQAHYDRIIEKTNSKNIVGVVIYAIEHNIFQVNIESDKIKVLNVEF